MNLFVWLASASVWRLPKAAREFEEVAVIYLTAVIAVLLFIYLVTALVRPEWF
jgi:K+-transporting ATPase KdpF subunit